MNYKLFLHSSKKFVVFHWNGPISIEDRIKNVARIKDFCKKNHLKKILIDTRDQINEDTIVNQYAFPQKFMKELRGFKIAIINKKDDEAIHFMLTVALNWGNYVKAFYSMKEAMSWLKVS